MLNNYIAGDGLSHHCYADDTHLYIAIEHSANLHSELLRILQSVQNSAARIVTKTAPREHITPVLKELHWLPVDRRIECKILLYAYKALNGLAPEYLCNMVELYAPDRVI